MMRSITVTNFMDESIKLPLDNPYESGLAITSITGIGPTKANVNMTDLAISDGAIFNSARIGSRNIVITFRLLEDPKTGLVEDSRQRTYKYFPLKKMLTLQFETTNRLLAIQGYVESNEPDIFQKEETAQISIICSIPYFYHPNSIVVLNGIQPGFSFKFSNESLTEKLLSFGEIVDRNGVTYDYTGDVETGVLFRIFVISSPLTKLSLTNITTNTKMDLDLSKVGFMMGDQAKLPIAYSTKTGDNVTAIYDGQMYLLLSNGNIYVYDNNTNKWGFRIYSYCYYDKYLFVKNGRLYALDSYPNYYIDTWGQTMQYNTHIVDVLRGIRTDIQESVTDICVLNNLTYIVCAMFKSITLTEYPDAKETYVSYSKICKESSNFIFQDDVELPMSFSDYNNKKGSIISFDNKIHFLGFNGKEITSAGKVCVDVYENKSPNISSITKTPLYMDYGRSDTASWAQHWSRLYTPLIYRNEIHILGGYNGRGHYKWNGSSWTQVSTLPDVFCLRVPAVVFQDEIHIFGGYNIASNWIYSYHYKWDGSSWTKLTDTPFVSGNCYAFVINNNIHILGSSSTESTSSRRAHYRWDGRVYTQVSTLPINSYSLDYLAFLYNNKIYLCKDNTNVFYVWNGSSWSSFTSDYFYGYSQGTPIEYKGLLYYMSVWGSVDIYDSNLKWVSQIGTYWQNGLRVERARNMVIYNDQITIMDCAGFIETVSDSKVHYSLTSDSILTREDDLPYNFTNGASAIYNNELHIFGGEDNPRAHYKWDGQEWVIVSILPYDFIKGSAEVIDNEIHLIGGINHLYDHYVYDGDEWYYNKDASIHAGDNIYLSTVAGNRYIKGVREDKEYNLLPALDKNTDWISFEKGENNIIYQTSNVSEEKNVTIEVVSNNLYEGV